MTEPARSARQPVEEPRIAIPVAHHGVERVLYFVSDDQADQAAPPRSVQRALELAGAWADLDWDEAEAELDRIRHASRPTPPIEV